MFRQDDTQCDRHRRPAAVAVFTVVMIGVLLGFAALTIDVGLGQVVRADLQRTADSAALAAVQDLHDSDPDSVDLARFSAAEFVARNPILNGRPALYHHYRDVTFGRARISSEGTGVEFKRDATPPNAAEVTVRYDLEFLFARIFGLRSRIISAVALAAVPPPRTVDVIPASLPTPGFGPIDPDISEHNPGKTSPSEPANEERFVPDEEVVVFIFGKGPRQAVHLVLDITESRGVAELNRLLATEESLGGEREPVSVSIGDEYFVWGEGKGNANFGEKLMTRIEDYDPNNNTVIMPIVQELEYSRDDDGSLVDALRVVDFVAVTLTEAREIEVSDPTDPTKTTILLAIYARVIELFSGSAGWYADTSGRFTLGSVRTAPVLLK